MGRNILQKGGANLIKTPLRTSQSVNTKHTWCPTNTQKLSHSSGAGQQPVHHMGPEAVLLRNPESSSSIHHNLMSETGIWDTYERGPKIGLIDRQHGGLREGQQAEQDVNRSAALHSSYNATAERTIIIKVFLKSLCSLHGTRSGAKGQNTKERSFRYGVTVHMLTHTYITIFQ